MEYITADYYPRFMCKCGECRHNCCNGWPVTISKREYDRLMEAPCSEAYHEQLKNALRMNFRPEDDRYAHIVHDKYGNCMLQRRDGLCGLQVELGEAVLPDVCRLYPRNRRCTGGENECALSGSCEAVVETLLKHTEPLHFVKTEIAEAPLFPIDMTAEQKADCARAIEIMEDRTKTFPERFAAMGEELFGCTEPGDEEQGKLEAAKLLVQLTDDSTGKSKVAGMVCAEALRCFGMEGYSKISSYEAEELLLRYEEAKAHVFKDKPDWEAHVERLLVNHMFYNSFPHVGGTNDHERAFYGLCTIYAFSKFVFVGNLRRWANQEDEVDVLSELGRMIEHSDFKYKASQFYRKYNESCPGYWRQLVSL